MSRFFLTFVLLLPLFICSCSGGVGAGASSSSSHLIEQACKNAPDKIFCVHLLRSDRTSSKADLKGLAFIALRKVQAAATATSLSIKVSLDNQEISTELGVEDALIDCSEHYLTLVELVDDSINALVSNSPKDLKNFVVAAVDDLKACDVSLKGLHGPASQVATRNKDLHKLINTAVSVIRVSQSAHRLPH